MHKDLSNPYYLGWLRHLEAVDNANADDVAMLRWQNIKRVVESAFANCIGYRVLYESVGFDGTLESMSDFERLPYLTKSMLRDRLDEFSLSNPYRYKMSTGGSTGIPVHIYHDPITFAKELASKAWLYRRVGWSESDRQITLRGLLFDGDTQAVPELNELRFSTFKMNPEKYRRMAVDYGAEWLRCYPSAGYLFARWLSDSWYRLPLKGVLCASEKLYFWQKELMADVFQCRIFSHYGQYELAALAGFCEYRDTYHVLPSYGYAEILRDGKRVVVGNPGEIVATSFISGSTPIIRYKTGDIALYAGEWCDACGRPNQIWADVEGRECEFIITKTGRRLSPAMLNEHGDIYDDLLQFQYYQNKRGVVEFRFVPKCDDIDVDGLEFALKRKLGRDIDLIMRRTEHIDLTQRGKHGFLVQELDNA